jgi:hypothetical protein
MSIENKENYGRDDRDFHFQEPIIADSEKDESESYVDQYENITLDNDNPEEETIVNTEDTITNDEDDLDQSFLDALEEDQEEEKFEEQIDRDGDDFQEDNFDNE